MPLSVRCTRTRHASPYLLGLLTAALVPALPAGAAEGDRSAFDLPADSADASLRRFSEQAGRGVLFATRVTRGVRTNPVKGELTPLEAIDALLADTGLVAVHDSKTGAISVRRETAEEARARKKTAEDKAAPTSPETQTQNMNDPMKQRPLLARVLATFALMLTPTVDAAEGTGSIHGRVLNPATSEYVRNAEIRIEGTNFVTFTEQDGSFRFPSVPAGDITLNVTYSGYTTTRDSFRLETGGTAVRDISIAAIGRETRLEDGTIRLESFVVSSEREGNAKAIMDQKSSMNITNSIASDVFGDVAEGNVGEFLKYIPGIDLELTQGEIRNVRLRGLGSDYNSVTIDGVTLASADGGTVGGVTSGSRSFSFDQVSLSSMEAIEVSKTVSADVDANAPAGTINLKTKRAFSREGRRISVQANLVAVDGRFSLGKSYGPDDARHHKIRPGGILEYSDVFLNRRLGVVLTVSESNRYLDNTRSNIAYSYDATTADPRPVVPRLVTLIHSPSLNRRSTVSLTSDFKATPNLVLSLGLIYNHSSLGLRVNRMQFNPGTRGAIVGDDPLISFTSAPNGIVISRPSVVGKLGETYTVLPKFEYKRGNLLIEGRFAGSDSTNWYDPFGHFDSVQTAGDPRLTGVTFRAERSSLISGDWKLTQLAGPDIADGSLYPSPIFRGNDGRYARTQVYSGDIAVTWKANMGIPITWKAGVKQKVEIRDYRNLANARQFSYVGPDAGTGSWAPYNTSYVFDLRATNAGIVSSSGRPAFMPSLLAIGALMRERPADFTNVVTPANFRDAFISNTRHYEERIPAGFLMGTADVGKATMRAGVRWEGTETDALEHDPLSPEEVRAAGFPVSAGQATTIPGLEHQYFSNPRVHRKGRYDHLFPSASFKYRFSENFDFHAGYSKTIRRPTVGNVAGVWVINDENLTVNAPNPKLRPEISDNFAARLAYYFEPVGILGFNVFQNAVKGLHRFHEQTAAEFGYAGDLDLSDYRFITTLASAEEVVIRGMELEYSQTLSFLPSPLKELHLRASYTRNYADVIVPEMSPHGATLGLSYAFKRISVYTNCIWRDDTPTNIDGTGYFRHRITADVGGAIRLTPRFSLFFTGRNIGNEPYISMEKIGANPAVPLIYEVTGALWTFGVKGVF